MSYREMEGLAQRGHTKWHTCRTTQVGQERGNAQLAALQPQISK
jgi:hypothetical protein